MNASLKIVKGRFISRVNVVNPLPWIPILIVKGEIITMPGMKEQMKKWGY